MGLEDPQEFLSYMLAAADDGTLVSGAQLNRLRQMDPKPGGVDFPPTTWYEIKGAAAIEPAVKRARAAIAVR